MSKEIDDGGVVDVVVDVISDADVRTEGGDKNESPVRGREESSTSRTEDLFVGVGAITGVAGLDGIGVGVGVEKGGRATICLRKHS
jgi:hypothetical protein